MNIKNIDPAYLTTKKIPVEFDMTDSIEVLWKIHNNSLMKKSKESNESTQTLLDLKIHIAERIFSDCILCEKHCHIDRNTKNGACQVTLPRIASEFLHMGEERYFIPSHTIFFSGCNFHCLFCQNFDISQHKKGLYINSENMAQIIQKRYHDQSRNVNWVGGEPTPNLLYILNVLKHSNTPLPQIWNSNMYCSKESLYLLNGIIDVFLADFKFGNNKCAEDLAGIPDYKEIITRNLHLIYLHSELFIRHLVLPNHIDCCSIPILKWIASNLPNSTINIMDQYYPAYQAKTNPLLSTQCTKKEIRSVKKYANNLGLTLYQ